MNLKEIKVGDLIIIDNPFLGEDVAVCSSILDVDKYPFNNVGSARKYYMKDRKPVFADEQGETGNEMIKEYHFMSGEAGDYNFREDDDISNWNPRKIDKTHPKWNQSLSESGQQLNGMLSMFGKMFEKF